MVSAEVNSFIIVRSEFFESALIVGQCKSD